MNAPHSPAQVAEVIIRRKLLSSGGDVLQPLAESHRDLLAALKEVVAIADRKTDEFDRARKAIARAENPDVL
jgi:hypothetical protein